MLQAGGLSNTATAVTVSPWGRLESAVPKYDMTNDPKEKVKLVKEITRRLLISLFCLIVASGALLAAFLYFGAPVSVWAVVMAFGMAGGFISIQRRLKQLSEDDLQLLASSWPYVFLSPLTGGILAVILYLLFVSRLLTGELFPAFEPGAATVKDFSRLLECTAVGYEDYAKIMFWAFVAGFSEAFVTDIIGSFARGARPEDPHPR